MPIEAMIADEIEKKEQIANLKAEAVSAFVVCLSLSIV